jgi:hypothetical protein
MHVWKYHETHSCTFSKDLITRASVKDVCPCLLTGSSLCSHLGCVFPGDCWACMLFEFLCSVFLAARGHGLWVELMVIAPHWSSQDNMGQTTSILWTAPSLMPLNIWSWGREAQWEWSNLHHSSLCAPPSSFLSVCNLAFTLSIACPPPGALLTSFLTYFPNRKQYPLLPITPISFLPHGWSSPKFALDQLSSDQWSVADHCFSGDRTI